jgi:biotin transporter BioY
MTNKLISDEIFGKQFFAKYYLVILGVILLTVTSKISIPFFPAAMTLQTLIVYFISSFMGIFGFYSVLIYLILGTLGLPLFTNGGGLEYLVSPMYGFLYGMVFSSFIISYILKKGLNNNLSKICLAILSGFFTIYFFGVCHLSYFIGFKEAFLIGFLPFIYSELLKVILSIMMIYGLILKINKK